MKTKIGFDFDGTLGKYLLLQTYAKELVKNETYVCVITKRNPNLSQEVFDLCLPLGILQENIIFTNNLTKVPIVNELELTKFYDDEELNINEINKYTNAIGILVK
ncbi:MAG TPA: hypothetical protein VNX68_12830 [Nitrosopumilaceae archaeon]|jgi:hypothetical protein|nr:hypothetical protein [Nitrosopumilaceae archaeon]